MKLRVPSPGVVGAALPFIGIGVAIVCGIFLSIEIGLLLAAGAALLGVVALLWGSVQALTGDSPLSFEEALTLGAPSAEEEQKWAVLRALKDLEYERSVGKISDADYAELSARYREDAKRLIAILDKSLLPARERAEKALAERLAKAGSAPPKPAPRAEAAPSDAPAAGTAATSGAEPPDAEPAPRAANKEGS